MVIGTLKVYFRADWVMSLKEKRSAVKGITEKTKSKFNVSVAEVERQDDHKSIVLGVACVTNDSAHANSILDNVLKYMESITDAVMEDVVMEIL